MAIDFSITRDVKDSPGIYYAGSDIYVVSSTGMVVLADRDLGATEKGAEGKVFQWGNNYAFPNDTSTVATGSPYVDVTDYGPPSTNPNGYYSSDIWIKSGSSAWFTNPADPTAHGFKLWGGDTPQSAVDISTPAQQIDRRGPCPARYFIPSTADFNLLLLILADFISNITITINSDNLVKLQGSGIPSIAEQLFLSPIPHRYRENTGSTATMDMFNWRLCNEHLETTRVACGGFGYTSGAYSSMDADRPISPAYGFPIRPFKAIQKR